MAKPNAFKPNKGVRKRFKVTARGKVKRAQVGLGHLCSKKSGNRRRRLRRMATAPACEQARILKQLGLLT